MSRSNARVSFRISTETRDTVRQVAEANGLSMSELVREFLYRYVATAPEPTQTRSLPNTRGSKPVTVYIGENLAHAAHRTANRNGEDLSRPIAEFMARIADEWDKEQETNTTS